MKDEIKSKEEINKTFYYHFKENIIDIYFNPLYLASASEGNLDKEEVDLINNELEFSNIVYTDVFRITQVFKEPSSLSNLEKFDTSSFIFNNIDLLFMLSFGFILAFFTIILLLRFTNHRIKIKIEKIILKPIGLNEIHLFSSQAALIYVFFSLFFYIVQSILMSSIKTESVIVNTDEFINSISKLKETKKFMCIFHYQKFLLENSPKTSDMHQIYRRKIEENKFVEISPKIEFWSIMKKRRNKIHDYFIFSRIYLLYSFLIQISRYTNFRNHFIFFNAKNYYEFYFSHYMKKNLDKNVKKVLNFR